MSMSEMPHDIRDAVESEREPGERLVWVGLPDPKRAVKTEWGAFIFGIPWTAFALFWEVMAIGMGLKTGSWFLIFFVLFGLPFVGIGFAMLSAPFRTMQNVRRMIYAITDKRIIIIERKGAARKIHSYVPRYATDLERVDHADGSGDLTFAVNFRRDTPRGMSGPVGLYGVPDVRVVERIIREAFFQLKEGQPAPSRFGVGGYR